MAEITSDHDLLIRVEGKLDNVIEKLGEIPPLEGRVRCLESGSAAELERMKTMSAEINTLRLNASLWASVNSVAAAILSIYAIWKG